MNINKVFLMGRVGKQPEIKLTGNGDKMAYFSLATTERYKDRNGERQETTEWHNIVVFGKRSEIVESYVNKGDLLHIEGKLKSSSFEKDGIERKNFQIHASEISLMPKSLSGGGGAGNSSTVEGSKVNVNDRGIVSNTASFPVVPSGSLDDDIPF